MGDPSKQMINSSAGFSRRRSNFALREPKKDDGGIQICNRLGCSTRYNSSKDIESSNTNKLKTSRLFSRNKALTGSSSKSSPSVDLRKRKEHRISTRLPQGTAAAESSRRDTLVDESESSSGYDDMLDYGSVRRVAGKQVVDRGHESTSEILDGTSSEASGTSGCSANTTSNTKKQIRQRDGLKSADVSSPPIQRVVTSQSSTQVIKPVQVPQRRLSKNPIPSRIADDPSSSSSTDSASSRRTETLRKRLPIGSPSTSNGRSRITSSSGGSSGPSGTKRNVSPSIFERLISQPPTRGSRNPHPSRIDSSARVRRNTDGENRMRLSEQREGVFSLSEPHMGTHEAQRRFVVGETSYSRPQSSSRRDVVTRPSSSNSGTSRRRQIAHIDEGTGPMYHSTLADRHSSQHLNIEGIAEMLLALERIEQEDLTYEQLVSLETNFILNGLGLYDQHSDMRLDIDNMSYEELLALGEEMGTVSTALSEEQLSTCLKRSFYQPPCTTSMSTKLSENDIKCSICQEEYVVKVEVAKLVCDHMYHVDCIQQWLRQKNWCPICKASACSS